MIAALLIAGSWQPTAGILTDHVDRIEHNCIYREGDPDKRVWFEQWIFWDWDPVKSRWECVDWRRAKATPPVEVPP